MEPTAQAVGPKQTPTTQEPWKGDRRPPSHVRVPGLTPWAKVRRPSGAQNTDICDIGTIVISDKVYE
jgi:hypothetical protein